MTTKSPVQMVVRLQCWGAFISFLMLLSIGKWSALSWLFGAMIAIASALLYGAVLRKINDGKRGALAILYLHFVAELAKLAGIFIALLAVLIFFRQAEWAFAVGGCIAAYSAYGFALLIKN